MAADIERETFMSGLAQAAQNRIWVLIIAAAVDLLIGDPPELWHPVQGIGVLISGAERILRRMFGVPWRERAAGLLTVFFVLSVSAGIAAVLLFLCGRLHPFAGIAAEGFLCGRLLALRSLGEAGVSVRDPLKAGNIEEARRAVSMIVGRDTDRLDAEGITKAAVETVAENTSDGVTAPLFYMFLFGGIGGVFYKAVNTMDSMLGYRNERYRYFGTAAARLDDVMNFVPSRLTALFMIAGCFLPGKKEPVTEGQELPVYIPDGREAFRIWKRDRLRSPSPNSAQTESVCAGALHLCLLGDTWYFGELHRKEEIGDRGRPADPEDITRAVRLMNRAAGLLYAAGLLILLIPAVIPAVMSAV